MTKSLRQIQDKLLARLEAGDFESPPDVDGNTFVQAGAKIVDGFVFGVDQRDDGWFFTYARKVDDAWVSSEEVGPFSDHRQAFRQAIEQLSLEDWPGEE